MLRVSSTYTMAQATPTYPVTADVYVANLTEEQKRYELWLRNIVTIEGGASVEDQLIAAVNEEIRGGRLVPHAGQFTTQDRERA